MRKFGFTIMLVICATTSWAQSEDMHYEDLRHLQLGQQAFDDNLYYFAKYYSDLFSDSYSPPYVYDFDNLIKESVITSGIASNRLEQYGSEETLIKNIKEFYPNPVAIPAILELGSYYYNKNLYKKTIETYDLINLNHLSEFDMSEASFKKGYAHFVLKEFKEAEEDFKRIKEIKNEYYYPSNYYFGMCQYFQQNHEEAVRSFKKVVDSDVYKSFVPYYIAQIQFAQGQPEKVIAYSESALKDPNLRNRKEIRLLLGQSYFKLNNFEKALPHLEYYEANTDKLTIEEFYQVGFTHYQMNDCKGAIKSFKELNLLDSKIGQVVNYYLADCYYKQGDIVSARAAFKKVSNMSYDKGMQDEALFNYGKLSAEAGFEREAINTLMRMEKESPYYAQGQKIVLDLLENTSDFRGAVQTIEAFPAGTLTDKLKKIYAKQSLKYAFLLYDNKQIKESVAYFDKALKYDTDKVVQAQAWYWKANIQHNDRDFNVSNATLDKYFDVSNGVTMPDESSQYMAHYTRGYNMLELKDYKEAELSFKNAIVGLNIRREQIQNSSILNAVLPDALIRAGDCIFKRRAYEDAMVFYDQAISKKQGGFVYAMYQKAVIEGLMGESYEKVLSLLDIKNDYPKSEYADDALYQLGLTYFELDNMDNAYSAFEELFVKYPHSSLINEAHLKAALISYNKGDLATATTHYKSVMSNNPSATAAESALLGLQEIYIKDLGNSDEYLAYISTLPGYELAASAADSLNFKVGELRFLQGDYEKAITGLSTYLEKFPNGQNKIKALYYRGESNLALKKYQSAFSDYDAIASFGNSEYYSNAVKKAAIIAYNSLQSYEKAYKYYDLYFKETSDSQEKLQAALGALRSAFRVGNASGVSTYAQTVSNHPQATSEDKGTALYYDGKMKYVSNDLPGAASVLGKVPNFINNNQAAESRYLLAEIAFKQGDSNKAETLANKANDSNVLYPYWIAKSLMLMSDIYVQKKDLFNARAALEAVLENFKDDTALIDEAKNKLKVIETLEKDASRIKNVSGSTLELLPGNK